MCVLLNVEGSRIRVSRWGICEYLGPMCRESTNQVILTDCTGTRRSEGVLTMIDRIMGQNIDQEIGS